MIKRPETRYARSGDVSEVFWEQPDLVRFYDRLASFARLILFDKRGTGLCDRVSVTELPVQPGGSAS